MTRLGLPKDWRGGATPRIRATLAWVKRIPAPSRGPADGLPPPRGVGAGVGRRDDLGALQLAAHTRHAVVVDRQPPGDAPVALPRVGPQRLSDALTLRLP